MSDSSFNIAFRHMTSNIAGSSYSSPILSAGVYTGAIDSPIGKGDGYFIGTPNLYSKPASYSGPGFAKFFGDPGAFTSGVKAAHEKFMAGLTIRGGGAGTGAGGAGTAGGGSGININADLGTLGTSSSVPASADSGEPVDAEEVTDESSESAVADESAETSTETAGADEAADSSDETVDVDEATDTSSETADADEAVDTSSEPAGEEEVSAEEAGTEGASDETASPLVAQPEPEPVPEPEPEPEPMPTPVVAVVAPPAAVETPSPTPPPMQPATPVTPAPTTAATLPSAPAPSYDIEVPSTSATTASTATTVASAPIVHHEVSLGLPPSLDVPPVTEQSSFLSFAQTMATILKPRLADVPEGARVDVVCSYLGIHADQIDALNDLRGQILRDLEDMGVHIAGLYFEGSPHPATYVPPVVATATPPPPPSPPAPATDTQTVARADTPPASSPETQTVARADTPPAETAGTGSDYYASLMRGPAVGSLGGSGESRVERTVTPTVPESDSDTHTQRVAVSVPAGAAAEETPEVSAAEEPASARSSGSGTTPATASLGIYDEATRTISSHLSCPEGGCRHTAPFMLNSGQISTAVSGAFEEVARDIDFPFSGSVVLRFDGEGHVSQVSFKFADPSHTIQSMQYEYSQIESYLTRVSKLIHERVEGAPNSSMTIRA